MKVNFLTFSLILKDFLHGLQTQPLGHSEEVSGSVSGSDSGSGSGVSW